MSRRRMTWEDLESLAVTPEQRAQVAAAKAGAPTHDYSRPDREVKPQNVTTATRAKCKPRGMNKTETAYAAVLDASKAAGRVVWWAFEGMRFRLAEGAWYTPDFAVMVVDDSELEHGGPLRLELHEVKGHWREAARVRIKVAADRFPFPFKAVRKRRQRDGGGWHVEDIPGGGGR